MLDKTVIVVPVLMIFIILPLILSERGMHTPKTRGAESPATTAAEDLPFDGAEEPPAALAEEEKKDKAATDGCMLKTRRLRGEREHSGEGDGEMETGWN